MNQNTPLRYENTFKIGCIIRLSVYTYCVSEILVLWMD